MVRVYKRKSDRGQHYSKEDLSNALADVQSGRHSARGASRTYNIPLSTIVDHIKGRRGTKSTSFGRRTAIAPEDELKIVECIKSMERAGFGLSRKEVLMRVGEFVAENHISTPFKDNMPGKDWFISFRKRHGLSLKKPQNVEIARKKAANPFIVYEYFDIVNNVLTELNLHDKPERIWNLDETSFSLDPYKTKIVGEKGQPCTRTVSSPGRTNITVLLGVNAAGTKVPPLIVFRGKYIWDEWIAKDKGYPGTTYAATKRGWMETDVFQNYFENSFLKQIGDERPAVVIYDGHATHLSLNLIQKAREENITIVKLPPHTSDILQPLDLAVMKPFKDKWDEELVKWQRQQRAAKVPKNVFAMLVGKVWNELKPESITNGFKKGGIYPLDRDAVQKKKLDQEALKRWEALAEKRSNPPVSQPVVVSLDKAGPSNQIQSTELDENDDELDRQSFTNQSNSSFESILLRTLKSNSPGSIKKKKTRVAKGAEVITHEDVVERLKTKELEEKEKREIKIKRASKTKTKEGKNTEKRRKTGPKDKQPLKKKKQHRGESDPESSCSDSYSSESTKASDGEELINLIDEEQTFQEETEKIVIGRVKKVSDYVLVKFSTKHSVKHFVGTIESIEEDTNNAVVRFLRKVSNKKISIFKFPENEDVSVVTDADIIKILPDPKIGRRGEIVFDIQFSSYNVQ